MSNLTIAERATVPLSTVGDPDGRRFPVMDASAVRAAGHRSGTASTPEAVGKRIIQLATRTGCADAIPDAWDEEGAA